MSGTLFVSGKEREVLSMKSYYYLIGAKNLEG